MARDNYSYRKYKRELAKKKKKEEKMQRKLDKKNAQASENPAKVPNEGIGQPEVKPDDQDNKIQ